MPPKSTQYTIIEHKIILNILSSPNFFLKKTDDTINIELGIKSDMQVHKWSRITKSKHPVHKTPKAPVHQTSGTPRPEN